MFTQSGDRLLSRIILLQLTSSIPFELLWGRFAGQSTHLMLRRASLTETAVDFKVMFKQGNISLHVHVMQELRDVSIFVEMA